MRNPPIRENPRPSPIIKSNSNPLLSSIATSPEMEKSQHRVIPVISSAVVLLGLAAFVCCVDAEFKKSKAEEMRIDRSMCYLPRSPAFGPSIAALVCLFAAQVAGTTVAATRMRSRPRRSKLMGRIFLVLSWISFGIAVILLGTGSSMNSNQPYGKGWMNGECYIVKDGVFIGSAVLSATTTIFIIGFIFTTTT